MATVAFAFQIYCDFSAYSDIARGSARMLGFRLMENFDCPYFAASIQDFWRRWHISLSSWFKDYLYFPLGGSRKGKARTCLNVMIVFFVSGLWHGAALTFVAWGLLNGLYQVVSKLIDPLRQKAMTLLHLSGDNLFVKGFRICFTFFLTCMAWVLFGPTPSPMPSPPTRPSAPSRCGASAPPGLEFSGHTLGLPMAALVVALCALLLGVMDWLIHSKNLFQRLDRTVALRYAGYFLLAAAILLFGSYGEGYDPQAFVYFQF